MTKLNGDVEVRRKLLELARKMPIEAGRALYEEGELIKTAAQERYVPIDLGTLNNSGRVHAPEYKGADVTVEISFGGAASDYALAVHEHPSQHSPPSWVAAGTVEFHPSGRGPKYLEKPLKEAMSGMEARLGARLRAAGMAS